MPGPASVGRMAALCAALLAPCHVGAANDNGATTSPDSSTPSWLYDNELQLMLPNSPTPSQNYPVLPLTPGMGLNGTDNAGLAISITGTIVAVDSANYNQVRDPHQVAYLSCDNNESSHITPDMMLNYLMSVKPKAIILYSEKSETHWCSFDRNDGPDYSSIVTMADSSDARMVLKYLTSNSTSNSMMVSITGKASNTYEQNPKSGSNSAVAMSVLYSVTGLITLLFLIIIATGTIRAHRNPERYGPRGGVGGRGRQSRAKGLARAVLDTIPIVKFGNNEPAKQDPEVELETQRTAHQEDQRQDATTNQESRNPQVSGAIGPNDSRDGQTKPNDQTDAKSTHDSNQGDGPNLGCSICTEDFTVGEDVRVLPCHHQFHPSCIDPWLVDVSGTCPLCRLDLQPGQGTQEGQDRDLPPPLSMDQDDAADLQNRNRLSRLLTSAGFRQLPREEQMAALRQMREYNAQNQQGAADAEAGPGAAATADENVAADGDDRTRRARFAAKLKEKFRIRTREQS